MVVDRYRFPHISTAIKNYVCRTGPEDLPAIVTVVDPSGTVTDFAVLNADDSKSYRSAWLQQDSELRDVAALTPGALLDLDVWFAVEEPVELPKELLVAEPSLAQAEAGTREETIRATATSIASHLSKMLGTSVVSKPAETASYAVPRLRVRATAAAADEIGALPFVTRVGVAHDKDPKPTSEDFLFTTLARSLDAYGYDGTNLRVATLEEAYPDSWINLPQVPSGSCLDDFSTSRLCHCPTGPKSSHPRLMMGVVRNSATSYQGSANDVTTLSANYADGCTSFGPDPMSSALKWATNNGASVVSVSEVWGWVGAPQNTRDWLFDYTIANSPYPTIVAAVGNDPAWQCLANLRNGLAIGGAVETQGSYRPGVQDANKSWRNYQTDPAQLEVPNLVAPAENVDSAGRYDDWVEATGGTSAATPIVGGIAVALQEMNNALRSWPEALLVGLMAGADEDVDGTWLNLHDGLDDHDGAGLVNGLRSKEILAAGAKQNGGNPAVAHGHDYGTIYASTTPAGTFYSEAWNVSVQPNQMFRVAGHMQARPWCPASPGCGGPPGCGGYGDACTFNRYPRFGIYLYEGSTLVRVALSTANSVQFIAQRNTSGSTKTWTVKLVVANWDSLSNTTYAVAWQASAAG